MFERYTERARRALFFAEYEADHHVAILPEHLLLGIVREGGLVLQLFSGLSAEDIYNEIGHRLRAEPVQPRPLSPERPFASSTKRALACAAEEADHLNHTKIRREHLLPVNFCREQVAPLWPEG